MKFTQPTDFTKHFPRYVYRSGKGRESVQWREAALDMANDRAKLIEALREMAAAERSKPPHCLTVREQGAFVQAERVLRELGEIK